MDIYWEIDKEVQSGFYSNSIKESCFWCRAYIEKNIERYIKMGNTCEVCDSIFNRVVNGMRIRNKNGTYKKIRPYTRDEVDTMFFERLTEVKENGLNKKT